ncbi:quinolinate synthase NadA [Candidatus Lokiarchaeum ossiferum]|uniref:quinolinate synthase NadA n=1 Tax=Candidatus Lokiarchaeum ossiferum TaxID=2951803 RepID=UPI00352E69AA
MSLSDKIRRLKAEKGVTILAHYYQPLEVQKIADVMGDSLGLAKVAKNEIDTPYILFAAVKFMAETASILNQDKIVLSPELRAGCPLSNFINPSVISEYKSQYPKAPLIVYVNTTAQTKAAADVCCTSSNALTIVKNVAKDWKADNILFGPDKNLAAWVKQESGLNVIPVPPNGNCLVHNQFSIDHVHEARAAHPGAHLLCHPESPIEILRQADYVGSTSGMIQYVETHDIPAGFILGTEIGLSDHLQDKYPSKKLFPLSSDAVCRNMKKITLEKILLVLESIGTPQESQFEVRVPAEIAEKAVKSIDTMMRYS